MKRRVKQIIIRIVILILLAVLALFLHLNRSTGDKQTVLKTLQNNLVEVHFIDVGQGDAILIEAGNAAMLIDAGENNKGSEVVSYLKAQDVAKLNYVVGTHPHSDHIGGLDNVIHAFPVDTVIMPTIVHTTNTYEDVLNALEEKNLKLTEAVAGSSYRLGPATFTIVAPNSSSYENLNDYSTVIRLVYGDTAFLLTGDAERRSEEEMLASNQDLAADVIKLGHHGSGNSSSENFLDAVNPTYAVISVGADNEYGHPHRDTLESVKSHGLQLYRTDKQGTIVFTSNGKTIAVNTTACEITESELKE